MTNEIINENEMNIISNNINDINDINNESVMICNVCNDNMWIK